MLPAGSISEAATKLRDLLTDADVGIHDLKASNILIGHPKLTMAKLEDSDEPGLNLFFYHVTYDGYPADGSADDPFFVRLYCLITSCGGKDASGTPSTGEKDLRLVSEVMRVFHEHPLIHVANVGQTMIAQLQIVPHALSLDNLNHIWSTQADTAYRLSVAYEMALAPVPLTPPSQPAPRVGDPGMVVWGAMQRDAGTELDGGISLMPEVEYLEVDVARDDWVPHICLAVTDTGGQKTLHYVRKIEGDAGQMLNVLVAGKNNGKVKLFWSIWRRKSDNSVVAWQEDIADSETSEMEIKNSPGVSDPFFPNRIDPAHIDTRRIADVKLPSGVGLADTKTWQAMLYAVHEWEHEYPAGSGKLVTTMIKSNTVLLYGSKP